MAKFYGAIGYFMGNKETETGSGIWIEDIVERNYSGDVLKNIIRTKSGETLNDNITVDNRLSIIADPFANENLQLMRYVKWMGASWKITSFEILRPRLLLTIGGVYNVQTT